ncbi:YrdB family protein [Paenibacillus thiaminolyticus]|uniref:YrdB family protein n=1 Tax=Paenibacillus thiaminolyticus TaxID=49283 RepID=A0ABT4FTQ2_PANTH|nr:YrdB family protein [Paenibacillus thiaminolyticus]MCY9537601.1 YrdB family protein [Paenibacillus thiaminolyticus]MCY9600714.1 YrdB family protein [Paenibacillus thiaminolyticus]MCY9607542.1 YrdB family protein [Paenibacillus thiaminolyticus]MCY9611342.1 YrdB family protein [Paenibacillus thiaminolyticus]MCY9617387.1 YrdB family protein [Paenibacillus thiaminolyticus]
MLELGVLAIASYWGFHTAQGWMWRGIAGIGLPLVLALLWSMMGSPKASIRLGEPYYFLLQLAMFGLPVVFLALLGRTGGAIGYGAVALLNLILMYVWKQ